jgi:hypothetical protein
VGFADSDPVKVPATGIGFDTEFMTACTQVDLVFNGRPVLSY